MPPILPTIRYIFFSFSTVKCKVLFSLSVAGIKCCARIIISSHSVHEFQWIRHTCTVDWTAATAATAIAAVAVQRFNCTPLCACEWERISCIVDNAEKFCTACVCVCMRRTVTKRLVRSFELCVYACVCRSVALYLSVWVSIICENWLARTVQTERKKEMPDVMV